MSATPPTYFVFGSNLGSRHGAGAARFAAQWHGASRGVAEGIAGTSYAIPTKDARLNTLDLPAIRRSVARFLMVASSNPVATFEVSRVGCGLAGYADSDIAPMFADAPANCILPFTWQRMLGRIGRNRVIVAGSRNFDDYGRLRDSLDRLLAALHPELEIVSGTARGADTLGERYALERGLPLIRVPAQWSHYGRKQAGTIRNQRMAWMASHLVAFWNGNSGGTASMLRIARADELQVRVVRF